MRASRLVALLLLLQTRGSMTAAALAAELEVSVRTIYRDLRALGEAGVPVYAEPGPGGGCHLVDGYRTRLTGLTKPEAEALFLAGMPDPAAQLGLGTVVAAAQLKVLAALPPELRSRATRVRQCFHLDAPSWFRAPDDGPHLATLAEAAWGERQVEVQYQRADRVVDRLLEPYGLVLKGGVWYLVARSGSAVRTYRASRVAAATLTAGRFVRPDDFDLAAYWASSSASFETSILRYPVHARITAAGLRSLRHVVEPASHRAALESAGPPAADGRIPVVIPLETFTHARQCLLGLGAELEVDEPAELRAAMAAAATALAGVYAGPAR